MPRTGNQPAIAGIDRGWHFPAYHAKRLEFEIMPGEADKTFKHYWIRIEATDHGVTQLTGFKDSDFHDFSLVVVMV
jgi:hypothetical protein